MTQPVALSFSAYAGNDVVIKFDMPIDSAGIAGIAGRFEVSIDGTLKTPSSATVDNVAMTLTLHMSATLVAGSIVDNLVYHAAVSDQPSGVVQALDGTDSPDFTLDMPNPLYPYSHWVVTAAPAGPSAPSIPVLAAASDSGIVGDGITNSLTPTVNGAGAVANAVIKLYDTDGTTLLGTTTADGSGNWFITSATLSESSHTLKVTQTVGTDTSGLSTGLTLIIDHTAPAAPPAPAGLTNPSDDDDDDISFTSSATPTVVGTAEANSTVTLYDTDGTTVLGTGIANGNGDYEVTITTPLSNGNHNIQIKATDAAGNSSSLSSGHAVLFTDPGGVSGSTGGAVPPSPTLASASDSGIVGDGITNSLTPTVNGAGAIAGAVIKLYDTDGTTLLGTTTVDGSGNWQITSATLSETTHTLQVTQSVGADTSGLSTGLTLIIDHTTPLAPPRPTMTAASDSGSSQTDGITNNTTPVITGVAEANSTVTLYDSDGTTVLGTATADVNGIYGIVVSALSAGSHAITAKATDAAGNISAASNATVVFIDTDPPTTILLPTSTVYTNAGINAVVGTLDATDAGGAGALTYQLVGGGINNADFSLTPNGILTINDPSAVGIGTESIRVQVTDAAGNDYRQVLEINVVAAGTLPAGGSTTPVTTTIDGVSVTTTTTTLPGGSSGTIVTIPVVIAGQGSVDGATNVADIPLAMANSTAILTAQVPVGTGLSATGGASKPAGSSLAELIASIKAQTTTHDVSDQGHLTGNGTQFLGLLASDVPLLVTTIVVKNVDATSATPLTLTGTSSATQHTALVIDTSQLATSGNIVLNNVDFAAVVGAATITGSTTGQIITGDLSSQNVIVVTGVPSQVYAGGGDDQLQYGLTINLAQSAIDSTTNSAQVAYVHIVANSTTVGSLSAATSVLLNGGTGNDTATFVMAQSAYAIDQRDGYVLVTDKADTTQQVTVTNTENLKFSDSTVTVESRAELTTVAGLYQSVLGRQADIGGFDYWGADQAKGVNLGAITVGMLNSPEAISRGFGLTGDATHDVTTLYQAIFGRAPDAGGMAYWLNALAHGQTIADVANGFVNAPEMIAHKLAATGWDLVF